MESLERVLMEHPFFTELDRGYLSALAGCASNVKFAAGKYIFKAGEPANQFYLIRDGQVAVEIFPPHRQPLIIATLGVGDILGWSWLFPPYVWKFHARAVKEVRAFALDGLCLRKKCEQNHDLGYELLMRFSRIMQQRLEATQLQLIDVYAVQR